MSLSRSRRSGRKRRDGFTLLELMVATTISAVVFAGIMAAYLFLGRNLTRLVNVQQQEVESRRALRLVTADVSAAFELVTATSSVLVLKKYPPPPALVTDTPITVTFTYSSGNGTLTRTDSTGSTQTVLSGLSAFTFTYYNEGGTAITSTTNSMKSVEMAFTSSAGSSGSGTLASYSTVSPRMILRNKQLLL